MSFEIRILGPGDTAVLERVAPNVFDNPIDPTLTREFLADPHHHLAVALDRDLVVGFASGVHYVHPDKPAELWVNELGVAESHRGQGIGKAVLAALLVAGRQVGCAQAWVLTDEDNGAALAVYRGAGGTEEARPSTIFTFDLTVTDKRGSLRRLPRR
jgi:ribosomal protein S18 acetylase RimI-like enzyme